MEVHPRGEFKIEAVDSSLSDINYFKVEEVNEKTVAIKLAQSLEDLVDRVSTTPLPSLTTHSSATPLNLMRQFFFKFLRSETRKAYSNSS